MSPFHPTCPQLLSSSFLYSSLWKTVPLVWKLPVLWSQRSPHCSCPFPQLGGSSFTQTFNESLLTQSRFVFYLRGNYWKYKIKKRVYEGELLSKKPASFVIPYCVTAVVTSPSSSWPHVDSDFDAALPATIHFSVSHNYKLNLSHYQTVLANNFILA